MAHKIIKQNSVHRNGLVIDSHRIEFRLAGGGFGGSAEQNIAAGRFGGRNIARFVNRNLHGDLTFGVHLFGGRRVSRFREIDGAAV